MVLPGDSRFEWDLDEIMIGLGRTKLRDAIAQYRGLSTGEQKEAIRRLDDILDQLGMQPPRDLVKKLNAEIKRLASELEARNRHGEPFPRELMEQVLDRMANLVSDSKREGGRP